MAASAAAVATHPSDTAIALADEGVPVRAIARSMKIPGEDMYEVLKLALADGKLIEMPKDDWPPGSQRAKRVPTQSPILDLDDNTLRLACANALKTTRVQSAVLVAILRRPEASKEFLHSVIESMRRAGSEPTDTKIVDVMIFHIRKKLPADLIIDTVWGIGYSLRRDARDKILSALLPYIGSSK